MAACKSICSFAAVGTAFLLALSPATVSGADVPPSYRLQFIGAGSVVAINNSNTVVGLRANSVTGAQTPLVSKAGGEWTTLPLPSGASSGFPTALNDHGVIAGVANMSSGRRAIRWTPAGSGYAVEMLPLLPGELASYATGINNRGQIVGARAGIIGTPFGFGWLFSDAGGLVDLNARYGWFATPNDINDAGVILSGTQTFDLTTSNLTDVGLSGPANYNAVGGVAINNSGLIAGSASLRSSSLNIISVFRYEGAAGWRFIAGTSKYTVASGINNLGDVGYGEQGAGLYLNNLGVYVLHNLLDPAFVVAGWVITGNGCMINDHRVIATAARNNSTSQSGAVLLIPISTSQTMRSSEIAMSASPGGGRYNVSARVTVKDAGNYPVPGATVTATWTKPKRVSVSQTAGTDALGAATFSVSGGQGTYKILVTDASKAGYTFDRTTGILSNSISILPRLVATPTASGMTLKWPTNAEAFLLQCASATVQPATWTSVPQSLKVEGTNFTVTVPMIGDGAVYRLLEE